MSLQDYLFTGSSKVSSCGFGQKRVRFSDLLDRGLTALQEPTLTVLLVLHKEPGVGFDVAKQVLVIYREFMS